MPEVDLAAEFAGQRPLYEAFSKCLETLLRSLISAASLDPFSFESRTKTNASFQGKIQREDKAGKYSELEDITDLSGVRIICFLQEECDKICSIIEEAFEIDRKNSISKRRVGSG